MAAKVGVVYWEKEYTDAFNQWATKIEIVLNNGVTASELRDIVMLEVLKLNKEIGLTFLAISPIINQFNEPTMLLPVDIQMLLALVKRLRAEVAQMAVLVE